jgi:hypothetical protein
VNTGLAEERNSQRQAWKTALFFCVFLYFMKRKEILITHKNYEKNAAGSPFFSCRTSSFSQSILKLAQNYGHLRS